MPITEPPALDPDAHLAIESLLAFWVDAGVDVAMGEAPMDRLAEDARRLQAARRAEAPPPEAPPAPARVESDLAGALSEARALAAAAGDLVTLEAAIAAFEGCGLRALGARRAVFARGDPAAPVMIVGEAPGAEEDAQGQPFVGRAGKLLDRMLDAAGLADRVFITNTVFWRPPGNRNPSPQEQAVCAPFVERAVSLVRPKVLIFAGGVAAKSLLRREEGILSLRGRWFDWVSEDGELSIPAMPMLHPAFLLRQPAAKKRAWQDLLNLLSRLEGDLHPGLA